MNDDGRAHDADIDARSDVIAPFTLSTLESLDDEALREVAYRRADSDADRMRARAAARLLASRHPVRLDRQSRDTRIAPQNKPQADNGPDISSLDAALDDQVDRKDDELGDAETVGERRTRRRRMILAGVIGASLVVGAGAGIVIERSGAAAGDDSLAVFDRPATPQELALLSQTFGQGVEGDVRLLREDPLVSAYGVRITSPDLFFFGVDDGSPQICVIAVSEQLDFFPDSCVPEMIFRDQGISGFLPALDYTDPNPELTGALGFRWGPRGGLELRDYSDELLGAAENRFSEEALARGLDIAAIRVLEDSPRVSTAALDLDDVEIGPAQIGAIRSTSILGSVRQPTLVVRNSTGGTSEAPEALRVVCLTPLRDGAVVGEFCASLGQFRDEGLRATFSDGAQTFEVDWSPRGELSIGELTP